MKSFFWHSLLLLAVALVASTVSAQQRINVVVQYPGLQQNDTTLQYSQPTRLSQVLDDAIAPLNPQQLAQINWSRARLGSDTLNQQFAEKRQHVTDQLAGLADFWQQRGRHNYRAGADYLRRQLNDLRYFPAFYMGIELDRTRTVLQQNPLLSVADGNTFYLRLAAGLPPVRDLGLDAKSTAAADTQGFALAPNGDIAQVPTGLYNRNQTPQCYAHRVSNPLHNKYTGQCATPVTLAPVHLLHTHALPEDYKKLNSNIAEILKFAIGDAQ